MNFLALDLGTKTGFAATCGMVLAGGTWLLAPSDQIKVDAKSRMDRRLDSRIPTLYGLIGGLHGLRPLDWIFFEDVQFSSTTKQTQLWASLRATVWLFASQHNIKVECCPTGTLKKFATGYGGADKEQMMRAACRNHGSQIDELKRAFPGIKLDDNFYDALHLLSWGITTVSRS
jgi:Holliday junction resolvasome RuvABC endonuclease subunit